MTLVFAVVDDSRSLETNEKYHVNWREIGHWNCLRLPTFHLVCKLSSYCCRKWFIFHLSLPHTSPFRSVSVATRSWKFAVSVYSTWTLSFLMRPALSKSSRWSFLQCSVLHLGKEDYVQISFHCTYKHCLSFLVQSCCYNKFTYRARALKSIFVWLIYLPLVFTQT